jgi:DnaJ like chaperone protein
MPWQIMTRALGLDEGGYVRSALDALWSVLSLDGGPSTPAHHRAAFTIAFVSLAAKMAKADGVVACIEARTFERLFSVKPEEAANVRAVFELAGADTAGYEVYASQIKEALASEPRLLRDVLDALFHIAAADGVIHGREDVFLADVAGIFGVSDAEFRAVRAVFVVDDRPGRANDNPYEVLGASRDISDSDLKAHHRQLVREHHPDSLQARGVPPEFHGAAARKLAVINAAYDAIMKERGLKPSMLARQAGE